MDSLIDFAHTGIQDLDDGLGLFDVKGDVVKPAIVHEIRVDAQPVLQSTMSFGLASASLIRVVLGAEPVSRQEHQSIPRVIAVGWGKVGGRQEQRAMAS